MIGNIFATVTRLVNAPVQVVDSIVLDGKTLSKPLEHLAQCFDEVDSPKSTPVVKTSQAKKKTKVSAKGK